jgi:N utilization substance protein A
MVDTVNALVLIADEHNIPRDTVVDALKDAIIKAYTKEYPETLVEVNIDIDRKHLSIYRVLKVVEPYEDLNDYTEIPLADAQKHNPQIQLGDSYKEPVHLSELSNLSLGLYLSQMFKHNVTSESNRQVFNT